MRHLAVSTRSTALAAALRPAKSDLAAQLRSRPAPPPANSPARRRESAARSAREGRLWKRLALGRSRRRTACSYSRAAEQTLYRTKPEIKKCFDGLPERSRVT